MEKKGQRWGKYEDERERERPKCKPLLCPLTYFLGRGQKGLRIGKVPKKY